MSGSESVQTDEAIGARVRDARVRLQLTQAALAQRLSAAGLNLHSSAVAKIEAGERSLRLTEAPAVSGALGVSLPWLVGLSDEAPPSAVDARAERALRRVVREALAGLQDSRLTELVSFKEEQAHTLRMLAHIHPEDVAMTVASVDGEIDQILGAGQEKD